MQRDLTGLGGDQVRAFPRWRAQRRQPGWERRDSRGRRVRARQPDRESKPIIACPGPAAARSWPKNQRPSVAGASDSTT